MKNLTASVLTALLLATVAPAQLTAGATINTVSVPVTKTAESAEATVLLTRLNEINAMNKAGLNRTEKKELRKEVRAIKHELKEMGDGVYLSVGALIIIILLLILLL